MTHTQRTYLMLIGSLFLLQAMTSQLLAQTATSTDVTVFAAASLTEAFQTLGDKFEADHHSAKIIFNFGGSQQLVQQIAQGAAADVFASANMKQMAIAVKAGVIDTGSVKIFARNRLVLIVPKDNPAHLSELKDLATLNIKIVLADSSVPVGQYAVQALDRCSRSAQFGVSFKQNVLKNVVSYEENVRAVLSKVKLGECDAGIVYSSDVAHDSVHAVLRIDIPDSLNIVAEYPVALVRNSGSARLAKEFIGYVLSDEASLVFAKFGFIVPGRHISR